MANIFENVANALWYLAKGPVRPQQISDSMQTSVASVSPVAVPAYTSQAFESHLLKEGDVAATSNTTASIKTFSSAWDETEGSGIQSYLRRSDDNNTEQQRKELCLEVFRTNPWVSACIDAIAKRITSGGFSIEPVMDNASPENYKILYNFCLRINDDWDFLQLIRSIIVDLLIYGEAYVEIVCNNEGKPYRLHKVDCITMSYVLDPHGRILSYQQQLSHSNESIPLNPKDIIRWWLPHPRANMMAQSPIERILDAVNLDRHMVNWITKFFEKGAKSPFWIQHGGGEKEATRFLEWFTENYTGDRNAHAPITTWGNTKITEFGKGSIEVDFPLGRERTREETLAGFGVPPMVVGVIKTAGIGGTGEDQEKSFQYNTCDPLKSLVMEKLNWRVTEEGFDIHDHKLNSRYADYRNDKDIAEVQDKRIRNGSLLVDEARQEGGKKSYKTGGGVPIFATTKEIIPLARLNDLEDEQRQQAKITLQQAAAQADLAVTQAKKAKEPSPPVPVALQQPPSNQDGNQPQPQPNKLPKGMTKPASKDAANQQNGPQGGEKEEALLATVADLLIEQRVQTLFRIPFTHPDFPIFVEAYRRGSWEYFLADARKALNPFADMPSREEHVEENVTHAEEPAQAQSPSQTQTTKSPRKALGPGTGQSQSGTSPSVILPATTGIESNITLVGGKVLKDFTRGIEEGASSSGDDQPQTGMMLALLLDEQTAQQLALPGGEPAKELHITLAYLGDIEDQPEDDLLRPHTSPMKIRDTLARVAANSTPLSGTTGGVARFVNGDDVDPLVSLVNIPGLQGWRNDLIEQVEAAGYFVSHDFDFTPHITLAYLSKNAPLPIESVPPVPLLFDTVWLCVGGTQLPFKLGDSSLPPGKQESATQSNNHDMPDGMTKAKLTEQLGTLFSGVIARAATELEQGENDPLIAYAFERAEADTLTTLLSDAYLAAKQAAHTKARATVAPRVKIAAWKPRSGDVTEAQTKAAEQSEGITSTYFDMVTRLVTKLKAELSESLEESGHLEEGLGGLLKAVAGGVKAFVEWKAPQIADDTWDTGADDGTDQAIEDISDAFTGPDSEGDPNGVRVRVIPDESSSDACKEYAGKDYSLDEAVDLPEFPTHVGCIHSKIVYLTEGESESEAE